MDFVAVLMAVLEVAFGLAGVWGLIKCMARLRRISQARTSPEAFSEWASQAIYALASFAGLGLCSVVGQRPLLVLVFSASVALVVVAAGGVVLWLRVKALKDGAVSKVGAGMGHDALVVVRSLQVDRVRGMGEDDTQVKFGKDEVAALVGVQGHLRMLTWATGRRLGVGPLAPVWIFWSVEGDQFLLYPDDEVAAVLV